jgi:hypothetical protein
MKTEITVKAVIESTDERVALQISGEVSPDNQALADLSPEVMLQVTTGVAQAAEHLAETYEKVRLHGHLRELFDIKYDPDTQHQKADTDSLLNKLRSRFSVN